MEDPTGTLAGDSILKIGVGCSTEKSGPEIVAEPELESFVDDDASIFGISAKEEASDRITERALSGFNGDNLIAES